MNYREADELAAEIGFDFNEEYICQKKRRRASKYIPTDRLLYELHLQTELSAARIASTF